MYSSERIIKYAMEMELYGHNFYKDNAEKSNNLHTKSIFKKLSDVELQHYEYLKNLLNKYTDKDSFDREIELPENEDLSFFDQRKIDEKLEQTLEESMIPDMNVLRMAYLIEEDFRDYYARMATKVEDDELKKILINFSEWEDDHATLFKAEYNRLMDQYMNMSWGG